MTRHLLYQVGAPAVVFSLTILGVCLAGAWSVSRLHANLTRITSENVTSLEAAEELEVQLRQLRFHAFIYVVDPTPERRKLMEQDHRDFEKALRQARLSANIPEEHQLVAEVQEGYRKYRAELERGGTFAGKKWNQQDLRYRAELLAWTDAHPVRHLLAPCQELSRVNKEQMAHIEEDSRLLSERTRLGMLLLGVVGPVGGLLAGLGFARALQRSVARLEVRVQDVRSQLDREVASVRLRAGGSLSHLEHQLDEVVAQVRAVVSQFHQQQQEVLRAEQLAAVGRLAASVAHEIRNPLTAIKMLVGAALRGRGKAELGEEDLRVMHGEVVRLEQTVQNLLDFARPPEPRRDTTDLRNVVEQALGVVRVRAEQQAVEVRLDEPNIPVVAEVDAGQLRAVLVNLLLNSLDAMPHGGELDVTLEASAGRINVSVRDTGGGISAAVADRLFTPFVSSKPTGTGLGLSVCRRVIQQHGGDIRGNNRPEGGAEFVLTLPITSKEAPHAEAAGR